MERKECYILENKVTRALWETVRPMPVLSTSNNKQEVLKHGATAIHETYSEAIAHRKRMKEEMAATKTTPRKRKNILKTSVVSSSHNIWDVASSYSCAGSAPFRSAEKGHFLKNVNKSNPITHARK